MQNEERNKLRLFILHSDFCIYSSRSDAKRGEDAAQDVVGAVLVGDQQAIQRQPRIGKRIRPGHQGGFLENKAQLRTRALPSDGAMIAPEICNRSTVPGAALPLGNPNPMVDTSGHAPSLAPKSRSVGAIRRLLPQPYPTPVAAQPRERVHEGGKSATMGA